MTTTKNLGIWMDHASADLMEFSPENIDSQTITSKFTHAEKVHSIHRSEHGMHEKEQHQQADYYKKLGEAIRNYDSVILFGPTDAKSELFNILKEDHRFAEIKMEVLQAGNLTENQKHAFVRDHFSKQ